MSSVPGATRPAGELLRKLGLVDTSNLVIGAVIGSGIFLVPSEIAHAVRTPDWMIAVWVIGGAFTLLGSLSLAELGAAIPVAGGIYSFIERAFGQIAGFVCGWTLFTVSMSGAIATLGAAFAIYLRGLTPLSPVAGRTAAIAAVLVLTVINFLGVRSGAFTQNVLTFLKVGGLLAMVATVFLLPPIAPHPGAAALHEGPIGLTAIGVAMVAVLWAYEGWHDVSFAAGEIRNPKKTFPLGLVGGTSVVVAIYVAANLAYLHLLTPSEIAGSERVALAAIARVLGPWAGKVLIAVIICSVLGAMNATILAAPRAYYQMARDGLLPHWLAGVHPRYHTPAAAIVVQGVWASFLILFIGGFSQLFTYVIFGGWIFYALAVASVLVLRRKEPNLPRPYSVPGYPWVPVVFVLGAFGLVASTLLAAPREALIGLAFIGLGIPLYFIGRLSGGRRTPLPVPEPTKPL
jgi:basic amino acid/polyamine antiporter, APA family